MGQAMKDGSPQQPLVAELADGAHPANEGMTLRRVAPPSSLGDRSGSGDVGQLLQQHSAAPHTVLGHWSLPRL